MRRSYEEIMNGIEEKSKKSIRRKNMRKKTILYACVSLLLIGAICVGFVFNPFKNTMEEPMGVIENSSKEENFPNHADTVDKSRYLSVKQLSANLMEGVTAEGVEGKALDDEFINAYADFGISLFKGTYESGENALSSPLSAMLCLAMVANGADGETKAQMESALGGVDIETLNRYLYTLSQTLQGDGGTVNVANSIWVTEDDSFLVNPDFLQTNVNYYGADLYKTAFDEKTVEDVNAWAKEKTKGMIEKIVDSYDSATVMQLINAVCFEAEWASKADSGYKGYFYSANGEEKYVDFMYFRSGSKYIATENATGVIKDYKGGQFSFVALMPNQGIAIDDYITDLDGKSFMAAINSAENTNVKLDMPKFKYRCSMDLKPTLKALGMTDAFDALKADFSVLGIGESANVHVSQVKQDTFIEVSELGTRAAAVTSSLFVTTGEDLSYYLTLDRPFVYAIIDTATGIPLFTGAVTGF